MAGNPELTDLTIAEAAERLQRREISPVELTRAHLDRIAAIDPLLNSFLVVTDDLALDQARTAEAEITAGHYRGPLHGIPIALKDLYETRGIRTTGGSKALANYIPEADSGAGEKLNSAGMILLGKLNLHEWALGTIGDNPHYGPCRNPWNRDYVSGGSSSGSGAALAARLCMGALGSDTGGSIRIPASLCGITGLKPTRGRVSLRNTIPLSWSLDTAGPMARTVRDCAILLNAIAGYDPDDPYCVAMPETEFAQGIESGIKGLRVALASDSYVHDTSVVDPEVIQAVRDAAKVFESLGAAVTEVDLAYLKEARANSRQMLSADAAAYHEKRIAEDPEQFGQDVIYRLYNDVPKDAVGYAKNRYAQTVFIRTLARFFEKFDLLLLPSTPFPAIRRDNSDRVTFGRLNYSRFTAPFNFGEVPALSVPCGFSKDGLPIGLQLVAAHGQDRALLKAGYAYEQAVNLWRHKPTL